MFKALFTVSPPDYIFAICINSAAAFWLFHHITVVNKLRQSQVVDYPDQMSVYNT